MDVAGFQDVCVLTSLHGESQSPASGHWVGHDRSGTQASSLLQMWRELEREHILSHSHMRVRDRQCQLRSDVSNPDPGSTFFTERQDSDDGDSLSDCSVIVQECRALSEGQMQLQCDQYDRNSSGSELSDDIGEVDRERVRQIFQEWRMKNGTRGLVSNDSHVNSDCGAQWLGENECERVRIIREWVRMTSQQRGSDSREEQTTQTGSQIEQVRDGFVSNHCEIGARRSIRKFCGRQTLLDLLARAERERKKELQEVLERRPVSGFAHKNRIQSLLRGRFLQSGRLIQDKKPSSVAASELGLLRQKLPVSGLREGFLSRFDNLVLVQETTQCDTSSTNNINHCGDDQPETNNLQEDLDAICEQSVSSNSESNITEPCGVTLQCNAGEHITRQEPTAEVYGQQILNLRNEQRKQQQLASNYGSIDRRDGEGENAGRNWEGNTINASLQESLDNECVGHNQQLEARESFHEQGEPSNEELDDPHLSSCHVDGYDSNTIGSMHWPQTPAQLGEAYITASNNEESDEEYSNNVEFAGWRNDNAEPMDENLGVRHENQWFHEVPSDEGIQHPSMQELHDGWQDDGPHNDADNFFEGPSAPIVTEGQSSAIFYSLDDDNEHNTELRELLSRRRVSSLLSSDFRQSLDQIIQSYMERQAHGSDEWESDRMLIFPHSPALMGPDQERQSEEQSEVQSDNGDGPTLVLPFQPVIPSQPPWEQNPRDNTWPRNSWHQHLEIEWEIVNDLRIDMARLQQRLDNMQRMLEACMDMQLELQRSVRQEVSAALNRFPVSAEGAGYSLLEDDESRWDHVRKGICCICWDNNIDSLLYRCGHMCTCLKCADKLVQARGSCPMCRAPVLEAVYAYLIQ